MRFRINFFIQHKLIEAANTAANKVKECFVMDKNVCIACSIKNCRHHDDHEDYCTLSQIKVGTHEANPTKIECVDCESFVLK